MLIISVTSNLSGEYGGSASGEIASFVTSSINDISSLKVNLDPVQDLHGYDKPWVGGAGANKWDEEWEVGGYSTADGSKSAQSTTIRSKNAITVTPNGSYYVGVFGTGAIYLFYYDQNGDYVGNSGGYVSSGEKTMPNDAYQLRFQLNPAYGTTYNNDIAINYPSTVTTYSPWKNLCPITGWTGCNVVVSPTEDAQDGTTYPVSWQTEAGTVYGGTVDLVSGVLTVTMVSKDLGTLNYTPNGSFQNTYNSSTLSPMAENGVGGVSSTNLLCEAYKVYTSSAVGTSDGGIAVGAGGDVVYIKDTTVSDATALKTALNGIKVVYKLATPQTYQLDPVQVQTLLGQNNVWSNAGDVAVTYNIPITNLLVKRQDVADVSGTWLTLYSQPITQASDMDFTFIDFTNQYGKTYKYALVPLLTQTQSGVEVEVEGGYTVSDEVQSIFDGVFIADSTGSQKCKANVGYGNVDMNQVVGSITPIGAKYPVVITNSQNQYHNGSISGTIVPDDYYFNGNLSRIDMVNKRNELEQFLTNKRAKIIKDWNSNIWLVMIMSNVSYTFDDNYGMGMVSFNADWVEVGDPTNQQDLYNAGLINVGGV